MRKIRVLFPEVEAGLGHIMPLRAVKEIFEKKYGDKFDIVSVNFFADAENKRVKKFGQFLIKEIQKYNEYPLIGYFASINMEFWGVTLSNWGTMQFMVPFSDIEGVKYMKSLKPDVVFSTHWATNYYAEKIKENKPLTIMYCPDCAMNTLFMYGSDVYLISMKSGYDKALKQYKKLNEDNFKLVPFLIRNEAFTIPMDKYENRKNLLLPQDNFTVVIADGGYGIGKLTELCEKLTKEHVKLTVVAVTGKNPELFEHLKTLEVSKEVTFVPIAYTDRMLEYIASADLFCGKSGNIIAEPTFFGVPSIITKYATIIEETIGNHYLYTVGSAMKEFESDKVVEMIKDFMVHPEKLVPYQEAAKRYHENYGAEKTADVIFEEIQKRYPSLSIED